MSVAFHGEHDTGNSEFCKGWMRLHCRPVFNELCQVAQGKSAVGSSDNEMPIAEMTPSGLLSLKLEFGGKWWKVMNSLVKATATKWYVNKGLLLDTCMLLATDTRLKLKLCMDSTLFVHLKLTRRLILQIQTWQNTRKNFSLSVCRSSVETGMYSLHTLTWVDGKKLCFLYSPNLCSTK